MTFTMFEHRKELNAIGHWLHWLEDAPGGTIFLVRRGRLAMGTLITFGVKRKTNETYA